MPKMLSNIEKSRFQLFKIQSGIAKSTKGHEFIKEYNLGGGYYYIPQPLELEPIDSIPTCMHSNGKISTHKRVFCNWGWGDNPSSYY